MKKVEDLEKEIKAKTLETGRLYKKVEDLEKEIKAKTLETGRLYKKNKELAASIETLISINNSYKKSIDTITRFIAGVRGDVANTGFFMKGYNDIVDKFVGFRSFNRETDKRYLEEVDKVKKLFDKL